MLFLCYSNVILSTMKAAQIFENHIFNNLSVLIILCKYVEGNWTSISSSSRSSQNAPSGLNMVSNMVISSCHSNSFQHHLSIDAVMSTTFYYNTVLFIIMYPDVMIC